MAKILIADDHEGMRSLVRMTLDNGRFDILEAAEGREALEIALREHPDLVFLDWSMPLLSGIEVCLELRANPVTAAVRVVLLTGHVEEREREAGLAAGAHGYITKPFSPLDLLDKVVEVLGPEALA